MQCIVCDICDKVISCNHGYGFKLKMFNSHGSDKDDITIDVCEICNQKIKDYISHIKNEKGDIK